jgi:hypothetical protein
LGIGTGSGITRDNTAIEAVIVDGMEKGLYSQYTRNCTEQERGTANERLSCFVVFDIECIFVEELGCKGVIRVPKRR